MLYWKRAVEEKWSDKNTVHAPTVWHFARRAIEHQMKVHETRQNKNHDRCRCYIEGWLDNRLLMGNDELSPNMKIVVKVHPVDSQIFNKYTPKKMYKINEWWKLTEDERLNHILNITFNETIYVGDAVKMLEVEAPEEPDGSYCSACCRNGHTARWCPSKTKNGFVPINRRRMPHGIPKERLRLATEDEYDNAFLDSNGKLMVINTDLRTETIK